MSARTNASTPEEAVLSTSDNAAAGADGSTPSDTSKLKTFLMILKRFIGVSDMAAVRFSLPAQLLEPIPNLDYWHYLDRPETFAAIGDSDDPVERMLAVLRFWFTKDLKYAKGKPCKPYNSSLGEFFRCTWEVTPEASTQSTASGTASSKSSIKSSTTATTDTPSASTTTTDKPIKVNYLTEQTSHHPPVSAFIYDCPEKGITAVGYDQLAAKFTGTSVRVSAGAHNKGIFITLSQRNNEEYHLTHPCAYLGGFLRGNLSISVSDICFISCAQTGIKVMLHYLEEGYFGKSQNRVEGVIYKPADFSSDAPTRLKDIPKETIIGRIEGCWTEQVYYSLGPTELKKVPAGEKTLLMDITPLYPIPKKCPPENQQLKNESRRFWKDVTDAIVSKQYNLATNKKTELEERQRARAAQRKEEGKEWTPRFFTTAIEEDGKAKVAEDGRKVLQGLQEEKYELEEPKEYGAL